MADQIRREDIISDDAIRAPLELLSNLIQIPPALTSIVDQMKQLEKSLTSATSVSKLKSETEKLSKAQKELNETQKVIITSQNEVIEYEKKLASESKKTGTVISQQEQEMAKAANAATAWGAAMQQTSKKANQATKEIQKGFIAEKGSLEELIQKRDQLTKYIDEEKRSQKEEAESLKLGQITRTEYNEIINASNTRMAEYTLKLRDANKDIQDHITLEGRDSKAINAKNASLKVLEAALRKNREEWSKLTNEEQRNSKQGQELLKVIQSQDKESKELSKAIGQNQKEVGGYTEAIQKAIAPMLLFGGTTGRVGAQMMTASSAMSTAEKRAKLFSLALRAIPILAIVGAIASLISYFKGTEEGAQRLRLIMAGVNQVFASAKDVFMDVGKAIFDALSNPKQAAIDLWEAIKENIVNRIQGTIDLFIAMKDAGVATFTIIKEKIKGLWGNEDKAALEQAKKDLVDAGKRGAESFIQAQTGIDNFVDKAAKGFQKVKEWVKETAQEVNRAVELQRLENELIVKKREWLVKEAQLNREINKQREIAADSLLTEEERLKAANREREARDKLESGRIQKARQELYIFNERMKLSKSNEDDLLRQKELEAEIIQLEADAHAARVRNTRQIAMLQTQIIERDKKAAIDRIKLSEDSAIREGKARVEQVEKFIQEEIDIINQQYLSGLITREKAEFDIVQLRRNTNRQLIEEQIAVLGEMLENETNTREQEIAVVREGADRRLAILKEQYKDNPELFASAQIQIEKETQDEITQITEQSASEQAAIRNELYKLEVKLNESIVDVVQHRFDEEIRVLEKVQGYYEEFSNSIGELFTSLTDRRIAELDREQDAVIAQREALLKHEEEIREFALEREGLTAEQKQAIQESSRQRQAEIEEEYAKKEEAIERKKLQQQRKAAIYEKAQGIASAAINTALAVIKTFATLGFPAGVPAAAAVGALGAIQIAAIAAKPIPQIPAAAEGIENHKGGPIRVGEEGFELIRYASGKLAMTPNQDSVIDLPAGASITPHDETLAWLALNGLKYSAKSDRVEKFDSSRMETKLDRIDRSIRNKKEVRVMGQVAGYRKGGTRVTYIQSLRNG